MSSTHGGYEQRDQLWWGTQPLRTQLFKPTRQHFPGFCYDSLTLLALHLFDALVFRDDSLYRFISVPRVASLKCYFCLFKVETSDINIFTWLQIIDVLSGDL